MYISPSFTLVHTFTLCLSMLFALTAQSAPVSAQSSSPPKRIAVLELRNLASAQISPAEVNYLSDEVRRITSLLPKERFAIMTKENIELMLPPDVKLEDCQGSCEVETGRLLQADFLITGELIKFGKSLRVSLKAHDTRSGSFLKGEVAKGVDVEELEAPIHKATLGLLLEISSDFKAELTTRAGADLDAQLACLKDEAQCLGARASSPKFASNSKSAQASRLNQAHQSSVTQAPAQVASNSSGGLLNTGLLLFGGAYALSVLGTSLTDPWPGQVRASLIPFYGPIKVEMINQERGDSSFMVANYTFAALQIAGLGFIISELINSASPTQSSAQSSALKLSLLPQGGLSVRGAF